LRLVPVFCSSRFQTAATGRIPVAHPTDCAITTLVNDTVMFIGLAIIHLLLELRKGSRSDLRNRILRPSRGDGGSAFVQPKDTPSAS
jgi:hypothetical protein